MLGQGASIDLEHSKKLLAHYGHVYLEKEPAAEVFYDSEEAISRLPEIERQNFFIAFDNLIRTKPVHHDDQVKLSFEEISELVENNFKQDQSKFIAYNLFLSRGIEDYLHIKYFGDGLMGLISSLNAYSIKLDEAFPYKDCLKQSFRVLSNQLRSLNEMIRDHIPESIRNSDETKLVATSKQIRKTIDESCQVALFLEKQMVLEPERYPVREEQKSILLEAESSRQEKIMGGLVSLNSLQDDRELSPEKQNEILQETLPHISLLLELLPEEDFSLSYKQNPMYIKSIPAHEKKKVIERNSLRQRLKTHLNAILHKIQALEYCLSKTIRYQPGKERSEQRLLYSFTIDSLQRRANQESEDNQISLKHLSDPQKDRLLISEIEFRGKLSDAERNGLIPVAPNYQRYDRHYKNWIVDYKAELKSLELPV